MYSPEMLLFMMCAPSVAELLQPATEHAAGQGLLDALIQCCFHEPHLQVRPLVPFLFFHPFAGNVISNSPFVN